MELSHLYWKIRQMVRKSFDISCVSIWCLVACQQKYRQQLTAPRHSATEMGKREDWVVSQPAADLLRFPPHHNHLQGPQRTDPERENIIQWAEAMRRKTFCWHHGPEVRVGRLVGDHGKTTGNEINTACNQGLQSAASESSLSPTSIQAVFNQE